MIKSLEFKTDLYKTYGFDFLRYKQGESDQYTEEARMQYVNRSGFNAVHVDQDNMISYSSEKDQWVIHDISNFNPKDRYNGKYFKSFDLAWSVYCLQRGFDMD